MKLAICSKGEGLSAQVDERFGRCPYFVIVDTEREDQVVSIQNTNVDAAGGAGPQAAQLLAGVGADAVALGNVGPNAVEALKAAKILVYSGIAGTVASAVQSFKDGKLIPLSEATVKSHSGMGSSRGGGRK